MSSILTRRAFLSGAGLLLAGGPVAASNVPFVRPRLRPDLSSPEAAAMLVRGFGLRGQTACAVVDVDTGRPLENVNGDLALPPASVAKALTALYALEALGPAHRFATQLLARGEITNGVLEGDLILAGGGDPVTDTDDLAQLAADLKDSGLRELRGRFIVWDAAMPFVSTIDSGQPPHVGYAPSVSGIALNFNRVHFEWVRGASGYTVTMDARTQLYRPDVSVATMQVAPRNTPIYSYARDRGVDRWSVAQGALGQGGARWLPVRAPGAYAGDVFRTLARSHGIVLPVAEVTRGARPVGTVLAQHDSAPLAEILRGMLRFSTNLTAEMVGMAATTALTGRPGSLGASAQAMSAWARSRYGVQAVDLVDHSGLGAQSRITADALSRILASAGRAMGLEPLLRGFSVNEQGKAPAGFEVAAKTGTLNFVSGLGGFVTPPDGPTLAFAVFSADLDSRAGLGPDQRERPPGARSWNSRARSLQRALLRRWGQVYTS